MLSYDNCNENSDKTDDPRYFPYDRTNSYDYPRSHKRLRGGGYTNIIRKYILKSIAEKKLRTLLIILSVAVSAALYFASTSISDTIVKVQTERFRASVGYTDIIVQAWWESPSRYFNDDMVDDMGEYLDYSIGTVSGYGMYQYDKEHNLGMNLWGISYDELCRIVPVELETEQDLYPFAGRKIIISSHTAEKFNLKAGDLIPIEVNGVKQKFRICGIAQTQGPFIADSDETAFGVVPSDTIRSLYNVRGKTDCLYIKLKNPADKDQIMKILDKRYNLYQVSEPFSEKEIRIQNNRIRMPFLALTIILSFMSIYIINSTFRVITYERLPDIGTFRSVGARKHNINRMLLLESLIYGSLGGIAGCALGVLILYLMSIFTMPTWEGGFRATISFEPRQLVYTFLLALILCLVSSLWPILKVNRIPVKDIILNSVESRVTSKIARSVTGGLLIAFGAGAPILSRGVSSVYVNTICIVAIIAGLVMIIPFLTKYMIKLLDRVYSVVFGNIGSLAVKNLRDNRSVEGSISLLAIGISCVLFVNTLSYSAVAELENYYDRQTYDIRMSAKNVDNGYLQKIRSTPGVEEVTKVMGIGGIDIVNKSDVIGLTEGIDTTNYSSFNDLPVKGNRTSILNLLDKGRGVLLTNRLRDRFDLKLGDKITLRAWGKVTEYTVVGFFESIENSGNYAVISDKYMRLDMGWQDSFYSTVLIKTNMDPDVVLENLKSRFVKQQPFLKTLEDQKWENVHYNEQIYLIAKGFSIITMLAGILGIFNNLIINFIRRRRSLAMYRSVGMSRKQMTGMILLEALSLGMLGSVSGVISGLLMVFSGNGLLKSLEMEMIIHYSNGQLALCLVIGIVIAMVASVWPALQSSGLNLMESIKYE